MKEEKEEFMKDNREQQRLNQIFRVIPDLFNNKPSVLYIGANKDRHHFFDILEATCSYTDVIEIGQKNCNELKKLDEFKWIRKIICKDIITYSDEFEWEEDIPYDIVLWSHGPNMIPGDKIDIVLSGLEFVSLRTVLLFNWGDEYKYPGNDNNNLPEYMKTAKPIDLDLVLKRGYSVNVIGNKNEKGNNVLAWRNNV